MMGFARWQMKETIDSAYSPGQGVDPGFLFIYLFFFFFLGGGGGQNIICTHAHHECEPQSPLRLKGRWELSRVGLSAHSCYLSLIFEVSSLFQIFIKASKNYMDYN